MRRSDLDEAADELEAVGATIERGGGIVPDFGREGGDFRRRDVGEVGHDQVKCGVARRKEVGPGEMDAVGEFVARGIVRGEGEGDRRKVGGVDFGVGQPAMRKK